MYDLVVRGGLIVDGSGGDVFEGDVAVVDGRIAAVGPALAAGREEIDARGMIVTPGFVDVHTHYDGQATWDHRFQPSTGHGVSTVVVGNCGVGFAPCHPQHHQLLVKVMEGVEDIPEVVMVEGLPWTWETFPDYLDTLARRTFDADIAVQIGHSALRVFVMGERGAEGGVATDDDLAQMRKLTTQAVQAGALGVSTSRSPDHRSKNGELAPSVQTDEQELLALAGGLRDASSGVFQLIPNPLGDADETASMIRRLAETSGRPVSFTLLHLSRSPDAWRSYLAEIDKAQADGLQIRGQVFVRPVGVLLGLDLSLCPFTTHPSFQPLVTLSLEEKLEAMRDPQFRKRILEESPDPENPMGKVVGALDEIYALGDPPVYEPSPDRSIAALARAQGKAPFEQAYDMLLENEGRGVFFAPGSNFVGHSTKIARQLMAHDHTIVALGDGGAHYGMLCDGSYPSYLLTRWVRDAAPDEAFSLPWAVKALAHDPAVAVGLNDRGLLKPGLKADINIIDLSGLRLSPPAPIYDLPAGGRRVLQPVKGYAANIVSGQVTYRSGQATGALPGRLVRNPAAA